MDTPAVTGTAAGEKGRRRFLEWAVGVFTSLIAAAMALPFLGAVVGGSSRKSRALFSKVTPIGALPIGRPVDVAYQEMGADAFIRRMDVHHLWVLRRSDSDVVVYSPICPHLGCRYDWNPGDSRFECPCHASAFGLDGRVLSGPAPRPLDTLPVEVRDGVLYVEWRQFEVGVPQKRQV